MKIFSYENLSVLWSEIKLNAIFSVNVKQLVSILNLKKCINEFRHVFEIIDLNEILLKSYLIINVQILALLFIDLVKHLLNLQHLISRIHDESVTVLVFQKTVD